ncbi:MAG: Thermosome subunit alpha [Methanomassiliicoccales archaeon PtaU1.Bin124]|nr:MAG: Thermosome subunit alpha [Methanomassiliicoccales archaeon PtaU1.Bin124]
MGMGQTPLFILRKGTTRERGKEAKLDNIFAARAVADAVRSTLGPRGMDKMLVTSTGDVIITNDGATIAADIDVQHPAARMMVEVAKAMDQECGDGTTTAMVLAGELLKKAEDLLELDLHPTVISRGYMISAARALQRASEISIPVHFEDVEMLRKVAMTAMMSKAVSGFREHLADVAVAAVRTVAERRNGKTRVDLGNIHVVKRQGGSAVDTEIIRGMVLDRPPTLMSMPRKVEKARIALLSGALEIKKTEVQASIEINDPSQLHAFLDAEEDMLRKMVAQIKQSGANVVICGKGIDELEQHFLAKEGLMALQKVSEQDLEKVAKATGGNIVDRPADLEEADLGVCDEVEVQRIEGEDMTFITGCKNPTAVSLFIRGGSEHVLEEADRSLDDALNVTAVTLEDGKIVIGGGATAVELAMDLREFANSVGGREQLAIAAYADALEVVPKALAENAGMDPMDILIELRRRHRAGARNEGVAVLHGGTADMSELGVIEPLRLVRQEINSATDAAIMVVRIDDIISSRGEEKKEK